MSVQIALVQASVRVVMCVAIVYKSVRTVEQYVKIVLPYAKNVINARNAYIFVMIVETIVLNVKNIAMHANLAKNV